MKREYKTVYVTKIRAPGDIELVRKEQLTQEIGDSYEFTGGEPVDPIILDASLRLHGGKHRFAAALNKGLKHVQAIVVTGTPEEVETLALIEQTKRRKSTDAEIARLVELQHPAPAQTFPEVYDETAPFPTDDEYEAAKAIETAPPLAPRKPGRPDEGKGASIKAVAQATGKTPAAVRQAEYRARKAAEPTPPDPVQACIDTMGFDVPASVLEDAQDHLSLLEEMSRTLIASQGALTRFTNEHGVLLARIREPLHDASALVKAFMPASVCLYCKCTKHRKGCPGCSGRGWVTASGAKAVTDERMKATGELAGIYVDGKWVKLSEVK
jgi:hypothetical protein